VKVKFVGVHTMVKPSHMGNQYQKEIIVINAHARQQDKCNAQTMSVAVSIMARLSNMANLSKKIHVTHALVKVQDRWIAPTKFVDVHTMAFLYKLAPQSLRVMAAMTVHVKTMARWSAPLTLCPANAHTMAIL